MNVTLICNVFYGNQLSFPGCHNNHASEFRHSCVLNTRPLLIIILAGIKSEVWAKYSSRQKVSKVMGAMNRPWFPRHKILLMGTMAYGLGASGAGSKVWDR